MKRIPPHQRGAVTVTLLAVLGIMVLLMAANHQAVESLRRAVRQIEKKQNQARPGSPPPSSAQP